MGSESSCEARFSGVNEGIALIALRPWPWALVIQPLPFNPCREEPRFAMEEKPQRYKTTFDGIPLQSRFRRKPSPGLTSRNPSPRLPKAHHRVERGAIP
jgi:hypothetical protein